VQRPLDVHAVHHDVDRLDRGGDLFRVAGQERLIDLQQPRPARGEGPGLRVERAGHASTSPSARGTLARTRRGERERPGEGELDRTGALRGGEREVVGQAQRGQRAGRRIGASSRAS